MSNVKFRIWQCCDDRPAISQETALKRLLGFSGVHDFSTESAILETTGSTANFEGAEGTWQTSGGALQGTGGGVARWYKIRHGAGVEVGFVATFVKTGDRGGFLFNCDDDYNGHLVWWTSTAVGVSVVTGATTATLVSVPIVETGTASVTMAVWPRRYSSIDVIDDLAVMLWFDGKHLLTHIVPYEERGKHVGFAVYGSDVVTFDDLRVPQLHQLVEWTSVDPGEPAAAGVSRVIGYEKVRLLARYDGSVRMWRNESTDVDWAILPGRTLNQLEEESLVLPDHFRLLGALHEVDVFRPGSQGHRFATGQDPNALSMDETHRKATRQHKSIVESGRVSIVTMAPNPVLEPEDVITLDGESWRVVSINYQAAWRGGDGAGAPVLESNIRLKECLES